jgi:hypothetical protein
METQIKRVLGVIIIFSGLVMFYWSISESYYYFTAQKEFPQVFADPVINNSTNQTIGGLNLQDQINTLIEQQIGEQMDRLIPENTITKFLNISVWSIFAFFLISAGARAVTMGREFLKDAKA